MRVALDSRVNPNTEDPMGRRTELIARPIPLMARCRPTASSLPPCSWISSHGLAMSVYLARSERRPALTSTARVGVAGFTDQVQHLRFSRKASAGVLKPRDFLGVELIAQVRSSMSRAV
jgi:hypothetical protein